MSQSDINTGQLRSLIMQAQTTRQPPEVVERLQWFLDYTLHGSVSGTCRRFGIARTTFYRWLHRFDASDLSSLTDAPKVLPILSRCSPAQGDQMPEHVGAHTVQRVDSSMKPLFQTILIASVLLNLSMLSFMFGYAAYEAREVELRGSISTHTSIDTSDE